MGVHITDGLTRSPDPAELSVETGEGSAWKFTWTACVVLVAVAVVVLGAVTLVALPPVYGDEPWIASQAYSLVHGFGWSPTILAGSGLWKGHTLLVSDYIGVGIFIPAALVGKTSLIAYRGIAFLIGLGALGVFGAAFRRFGLLVAVAASAALASSWGFVAASHYVRPDSLAFLVIASVLALLWRGKPGTRTALWLGLLLGLGPDIEGSILGLVPGVALLVGWNPNGRWRRLGVFGGALCSTLAVYYGVHFLPNPSEARREWHLLFSGAYTYNYTPPLVRAITGGQPGLLYAGELGRYKAMTTGLSAQVYAVYGTFLTLCAGVIASILSLGSWVRSRPRSAYPRRAVPAILLVSYLLGMPLIQGNKGSTMYGWYALPLAIAALAAVSLNGDSKLRVNARVVARLMLATASVIGVGALVVSVLPGWVTGDGLTYEWFAIPFVIALVAAVIGPRWRPTYVDWTVFSLLTLTIAATAYFLSDLGKAQQPFSHSSVEAAFHRYAPSGRVVLAEPEFWFDDGNPDFRSIGVIWADRVIYHWSFRAAIEHTCPEEIVVDNQLLNEWAQMGPDRLLAPTDRTEPKVLNRLLRSEYRRVDSVDAGGDHVVFWHRVAGCFATASATRTQFSLRTARGSTEPVG